MTMNAHKIAHALGSFPQKNSVDHTMNTQKPTAKTGTSAEVLPSDGLSREDVEKLALQLQSYMDSKGIELNFRIHEDSGTLQLEVLDSKNDKVLRKIPSDELLNLTKVSKDTTQVTLLDQVF
jgi:flagellar protein FlaG